MKRSKFWSINKDELVFDITVIFFFIVFSLFVNLSGKQIGEIVGNEGIIALIMIVQFFVSFSLGGMVTRFIKPEKNTSNTKYFLWLLSRIAVPTTLFVLWFGGCMHFEDIILRAEPLFIADAILLLIAFIAGILSAKKPVKLVVSVVGWILFVITAIVIGFADAFFVIDEGFDKGNNLLIVVSISLGVVAIVLSFILFVFFPKKIAVKISEKPELLKKLSIGFSGAVAFSFMLLQTLKNEVLANTSQTEYEMLNTPFLLTFILFRVLLVSAPPAKKLNVIIAILIIIFEIFKV